MRKLLIALSLLPCMAMADVVDWTRKGLFEVIAPDGSVVSRHTTEPEAQASAVNHAFNAGNTGKAVYTIRLPYYEVVVDVPPPPTVFIPPVVDEPPPMPPDPVADGTDTGEMLDPNTVFACDGGERGTTSEPTGRDSNSGLLVEGVVQPVLSLRRLEIVAERQADGVDYRLCEGAIFHDQTLTVRKSGDVGAWNRALIETADARTKEIKNYRNLDGWIVEDENYVVVGCYKILNGVPRPCMDSYPICQPGVVTECLDPQFLRRLPYYQG